MKMNRLFLRTARKTKQRAASRQKPRKPSVLAGSIAMFAASALSLVTAPGAGADTYYWDVNGTAAGFSTVVGAWNTGAFWNTDSTGGAGGTVTATTTGVDDLIIGPATTNTGTITLTGTKSAKSLTFGTTVGAVTLSGGTLSLAGGGGITVAPTAGNQTISSGLTIDGNNTFNVGAGRTLTLDTGAFTRGTRATLNVQLGAGSTLTSTQTGLATGGMVNGIIGPWASFGTGASTQYATFTGNNITGLTGTAAATAADVTSTLGTFNYDVAAVGTLGAGASVNTLRYTGAAGTIAGGLTTKGIMNVGGGLLTFTGAVTSGAPGTEMVINTANGSITMSGAGGLLTGTITKTGSGTMTLTAQAHAIGGITVNEGILITNHVTGDGITGTSVTINSGGTLRFGGTNKHVNSSLFTVNAGGIFDLNSQSDTIGAIAGAGSITSAAGTPTLALSSGTQTFSGVIGGTVRLSLTNALAIQTLSGQNTNNGVTTITLGTLQIGAGGTTGTLGTSNVVNADTLIFNRTNTYTLAAGNLVTGAGAVTLANTGSVATAVDGQFNTTGALNFGATAGSATVSTLDLTNGSSTFGSLVVRTNTASNNTLTIGGGKTLTINGNVTIGPNVASAVTGLVTSGGGNLAVSSAVSGSLFQIGGVTGSASGGTTTVDLSGLASFVLNYSNATSTLRLGDSTTSTTNTGDTLKLATANTITVGNLRIGDGTGGNDNHTLTLGSGVNTINATTVNIGTAGAGIRSNGTMLFAVADTTGTLVLRGFAGGTTRTILNMVNTTGSTGNNMSSTVNLAGHTSDLRVSTLTMATRSDNVGAATATLTFDQGTLNVTTLNMATRTGTGTGGATATLNLGDSVAVGVPTVTIGSITMAVNTSAGAISTANLNITGGNVGIGTGSGTAINMANAGTGVAATSALTITGGTVTVTGNIIRTVGAGTETATLALNGASAILDMSGNNLTSLTGITYTAGTLKNLGVVNTGMTLAGTGSRVFDQGASFLLGDIQGAITDSGQGLTKQGLGTLTLSGANSYTGDTQILGGILVLGQTLALQNSAFDTTNSVLGTAGDGLRTTVTTLTLGGLTGSNSFASRFTSTTGGYNGLTALTLNPGAAVSNSYANDMGDGAGTLSVTKTGAGTQTFTAAQSYTGTTSVNVGTLALSGSGTAGTAASQLDVNGGTFDLGGTTQTKSGVIRFLSGTTANGTITKSGADYDGQAGLVSASLGGGVGLIKTTGGALTLSGSTINYTGATTVSAGTLNITGSTGAPLTTSALTVAGGATLNTVNTVGQIVNLSGAIDLGAGGGTTTLGLDIGSLSNYDQFNGTGAATTLNAVVLNLTGLGGIVAGNYDLLTATSGLNTASYSIGTFTTPTLGLTYNLLTDPAYVRLQTAAIAAGDIYWGGAVNTSWAAFNGTLDSNFATTLAGANAKGTPGTNSNVIFSTSTQTATSLATTLDGAFSIRDLTFNNQVGSGPLASISIAPGTGGTLTLTPTADTAGINVETGAPASIAISAPVTLGANQTWTVVDAATNLASSGGIGGTANLIKAGAGIVTLSGTNNYVGTTTVNAGVLRAGAASGFNATSAHTIGASGTLRLDGFANTIGSLAGSGTVENNHASTAATLTVGDVNNTAFSGILQNGGVGTLGLTKVGTGTLTLSGSSSTNTGVMTVNGGVLATTGTFNNGVGTTAVSNAAASLKGVLYVPSTGSYTSTTYAVGNNAAGIGSIVVNGGTLATTTASVSAGFIIGNGGYGGLFLSNSGSVTTQRLDTGASAAATAIGVIQVSSGILTTNGDFILIRNGHAEFTISGGSVVRNAPSSTITLGELGIDATMNMVGGSVNNGTQSVAFGRVGSSVSFASLNLNANMLTTNGITATAANITGAGAARVNFNGGTIRASANNALFLPSGVSLATSNAAFGSFAGGAVIDSNGFDITLAEPILAPAGNGVPSLSVGAAGSGYIGAPIVQITGTGTGATGYATVDLDPASGTYGQVTGVVLTNPGINYTGTATVNFLGGGGTGATVTAAASVANASGGLTKDGAGILTLGVAGNTYTGVTTVNAGTLALGVTNAIADASNLTIAGGTFDVATFNDTVATVSLQSGSITGSTGVLTSTAAYDLRSGTVNFTGTGGLAGAVGLNKTTAGTVTLSGATSVNSFTGPVSVTAGTLAFSTATQLGNASVTNTLSLNGASATLSYTGSNTTSLAANQVLSIGSSGGTLDASDLNGVLNLVGGVTTASAANLTKTGPGKIAITGSTNLNGGNVTVSAGVLNAGFTATGLGGINVAGGATLNLYDGTNTTMAINALTLASGSSLGFDLNAPTVNDTLSLTGTASVSPTVSLNFNNLGSLGSGTYDLINVTAGTLTAGNYTLGIAPSGFNYGFSTINTDTTLRLTITPLNLVYWQGDVDGAWNTNTAGASPLPTNWASDNAGTTDLGALPDTTGPSRDTLVFSTTNNAGGAISTTLEQAFEVDSLRFINATVATTTSVLIASGTGTNVLTLTPQTTSNGISIADNAGNVTISAGVATGAAQTWEVLNTGSNNSSLTLSGGVAFNHLVTKTGTGVLTLSAAGTGAGGLRVNGGTLNIGDDAAFGTGTLTLDAGVTINTSGGARSLANSNAQNWNGNFTFTGSNDLNLGTGAVTLGGNVILTASGSSTLTVGGIIDDGASSFSLTKSGVGVLALNTANTFGGGVTVTAGTLNIGHLNALGSGAFTLSGGVIDNTTGADGTLAGSLPIAINGSFAFTGTNSLNLGTGAVTLGATPTITTTGALTSLTIGGNIAATGNGLTKAGAGTLILSGTNNYGGATTISGGTLQISGAGSLDAGTYTAAITNNGTLQYSSSATQTLSGAITGAGGLTKDTDASTLTLSSATTAYTGATIISAGTLSLNSTTAFASAVTVNAGGTLRYSPTGTNNQAGVGAISLLGTLTYAPAGNSFQVVGTSGANKIVTVSGGASIINISPGGTFAASTGGLYLDGGLQGSSALTVNATVNGFGLVLRTAGSTYSGTMTVSGNASTVSGTGSGLALVGSAVNPTLANASLTINGTLELGDSLSGMGWAKTGTITGTTQSINALNGSGVVVANMATAASTRTLSVGNNGGTGSFSGVIANGVNNTLSFTKAGSGTQTLSGANIYTGATTVSAGTLTLSPVGSITTAGNILLSVSGATAVANIDGTYTSTGGGGVAINSGGILNTSGTVAISGANNQALLLGTAGGSGTWNVTGGSVSVNYTSNGWGIGSTSGTGTLNVSAGSVTTAATNVFNVGHGAGGTGILTVSGTGLVTVNAGSGAFRIGANATSTGTVNLDGGTLALGRAITTVAGSTSTFNFNGGLLQAGLSSTTYMTGLTNANVRNGGARIDTNGFDITVGQALIHSVIGGDNATDGGLTKIGGGTLTLSGTNTYTGATTINNGTLNATTLAAGGSNSSIGASTNVAANLVIAGGILRHDAANVASTDRLFTIGGTTGDTASLISSASASGDTMSFTNTGAIAFGNTNAHTLTLGGTNGGANTFAPSIGDNTGATSLSKTGAGGTWILTNNNSYTGTTTISNGVLQLGNGSTTGALTGTASITNDANLTINRSNPFTQATDLNGKVIGGNGSFTQAGSGTTTLSLANTYAGTTTVSAGTLEVTVNDALGTNALGTSVTGGATLQLSNVNYSTGEALTINGAGVGGTAGALASSGTSTFAGQITAATSAMINAIDGTLALTGGLVKNGTTLTLKGAVGTFINISGVGISGITPGTSDLVVDTTTVTVSAASTYDGPTTITNGGILNADIANALPFSPRSVVSFTGSGAPTLNLRANQVAASLSSSTPSAVVNLSATGTNTLTVGTTAGSPTTFSGSITGAGGNLIKDNASTQTLSGTSNTYDGTTTVGGGTLAVTGSLSGTTAVVVNNSGTLLLNNTTGGPAGVNDIIRSGTASLSVGSTGPTTTGTVKIGDTLQGNTQSFNGTLTLSGNSILDMGALDTNRLNFNNATLGSFGGTISVYNWTGNFYNVSETTDHGTATDDRIFIGTSSLFGSNNVINNISFFSDAGTSLIGNGLEVSFGGGYQIVPIPEPATTALIGAVALCALIGYRERRRFTGVRSRMVRN